MDDISGMITQILNDPERLQQIMDLAKNFSAGEPAGEDPPVSAERMAEIGRFLQQSETMDKKQEDLVRALRPYLRPGRQSKLDRALQIAKLSHIAGMAIKKDILP